MSETGLRVVLVAGESAGVKTLRALDAGPHDLVMVLTAMAGDLGATASVAGLARRLGHRVEPAERVKDPAYADTLKAERIDLLLNVHSLFRAAGAVVDAPRIGSFNLHPGPLPEYAGLNCPSWAIYNGEAAHGVTLHWMTGGVDTGDVAYIARFPLTPDDTGLSVSARCVRDGVPLIARLLDAAAAGEIPRQAQDLSRRHVYLRRDIPNGGRIDWTQPARRIDAFIRAADYYPLPAPWAHPLATLDGSEVGVVKVKPTGKPCDVAPGRTTRLDGAVAVATGDEWLALRLIHLDGAYVRPAETLAEGIAFAV